MNTKQALQPNVLARTMRLDPFCLPQAMHYTQRDRFGEVTFTLDKRGATIRRQLQLSNLPATVALPANAFRGVAASAVEDDLGNVTVTLQLLHADPMLSVPLLIAHDLDDVAADWRGWADAYRLPMLLIEADGEARTLEESLGAVARSSATPRRQGRATHARRPRFLARRKVGSLGVRLVVQGQPIISAD
ncbi:DUF6101 family protein [Mesorhizobium sp. RP14(2022)]|jgi:hypothetical protein|uniref:DUF6101 family protein n=1 Tax=Mesorhizobium liriopis TaxID=2953882 RepID=A0ABT1C110_9HYPH|nr:DUF6101 family protein [Mesorhizobium liriopis]MCO6048521.1 DUF6101 family protein [Mesorhizobium liriopis]